MTLLEQAATTRTLQTSGVGTPPLDRLGVDVGRALADVSVPCYVLDRNGVVLWLNAAAEELVGRVTGAHFTEVVSATSRAHSREIFAQKIVGRVPVTNTRLDVISADGRPARVNVSSVPLRRGEEVVGVFGVVLSPAPRRRKPTRHARLTPRQSDVLRLLAGGASTDQIAEHLHLSRETVRNHIRGILRALDVHSRVEAVVAARAAGLLED